MMNLITVYNSVIDMYQRAMKPAPFLAAILVVGMVLPSSAVEAKENKGNSSGWGQWQAMGEGYVARRREPPQLDLPRSERRLENVQLRLQRLQIKKQKLLARLTILEGTNRNEAIRGVQQQLVALEKQLAKAQKREQKFIAKQNAKQNKSTSSLWLKTGEEGLYTASITDLAAALGMNKGAVRKRAKTGKLILMTATALDSEEADQPVSWHYDDTTDSVLFVGSAYETFYSDVNAYKFSMAGNSSRLAKPMAVNKSAAKASVGSEIPFHESLKFEEEPDMFFAPWSTANEADADFWWWDYLYAGVKDTISVSLDLPSPANTGTAQLKVTLRGWTNLYPGNEHEVSAELNGTPVGSSVNWDGFDQVLLVADFDQGILDPSGKNTLVLRNHYAAGTHPGQWLDQVEVDYQRMPVAQKGKLWMHGVTPGVQMVSGFSSDDIVVVESPGSDAKLRQDIKVDPDGLGGWTVTFKVKSEADYLVQERTTAVMPVATTDGNANLHESANAADYLVIAPRDFSDTAEALAQYRGSRFSNVKIVWVEDIYNEFSAGREDPFALARFMNTVISSWATSPSNVVLVGKGSLDQKDRMTLSDNFLPVIMISTPWGLAASDSRLLGFEDNTPFTIGRLPITNDAEGVAYVNKLTTYESITLGSERFEAVLVADNPDVAGDFHENSNLLKDRLLNSLGFDKVTPLYHPDVVVRSSLITTATWETGYVSYDGHGSTAQIGNSREKFITAVDAGLLNNAAYPIFTALTCAAGDDTLPGTRSLVGALVLNPAGGAIASIAPTGLSYDTGAQLLSNELVYNLFGASATIGQALKDAKTATSGSILEFMPRMYSVIGEPGVYAR